jgi:hypothetical protein
MSEASSPALLTGLQGILVILCHSIRRGFAMRWALIFLPLLLIAGCVMSIGSAVSSLDGSKPRIVDAPRDKVFDVVMAPENWAGFSKVTDTGTRVRYELDLTKENMAALGQAPDSGAARTFDDGKLIVTMEENELLRLEMISRDRSSKMRFNMHFAADTTGTKTIITSDVEIEDDDITEEMKAKNGKAGEMALNMMAGMVTTKLVAEIEKSSEVLAHRTLQK